MRYTKHQFLAEVDLMPTVETLQIGDRLTGHAPREIPFPRVATVVEKQLTGPGTYRIRLTLPDGRDDVILFVGAHHPVYLEPPF